MSWSSAEPPCWGMEGAGLLPPEWARPIRRGDLPRSVDPGRVAALPLQLLFSTANWRRVPWPVAPAQFALDQISTLVTLEDPPNFVDVPILDGRFRDAKEVENLPFLITTWSDLAVANVGVPELAELLGTGTVLDAFQVLGSLRSVLDLTMTTRAWALDRSDGFLGVARPVVPDDIASSLLLAQIRHVRQAGGTRSMTDPSSGWPQTLGSRAGCSFEGKLTLEAAGAIKGITRERVRQVAARIDLEHSFQRRWPLPDPLLRVEAGLEESLGRDAATLVAIVDAAASSAAPLSPPAAMTLLRFFGHDVALEEHGGVMQARRPASFAAGVSRAEVRAVAWEISDRSGFARCADVLDDLQRSHPAAEPSELASLISESVDMNDLPLGYTFCAPHRSPTTVETVQRMLDYVAVLDVDQVHRGIDRRFRFRGLGAPPPREVVKAMLQRRSEFIVEGDHVRAARRNQPDRTTLVWWIVEQIRSSDLGVLHRTVLFDAARRAGKNQSSVSVFSSFSELCEPVGGGCIALVGDRVEPIQIELARRQAALIRVPTRLVSIESVAQLTTLSILVGNSLRDTGVLSIPVAFARRFGTRSFPITAGGQQRGELKTSGTALISLSSALSNLDVHPGDEIEIVIDFGAGTSELRARLRRPEAD